MIPVGLDVTPLFFGLVSFEANLSVLSVKGLAIGGRLYLSR